MQSHAASTTQHRKEDVMTDLQKQDRLLKQEDVKEILGLADSTLEQWRLRGKGPKFVRVGRAVRYRESDIHTYIKNLRAFSSTSEADLSEMEA